MSQLVSLLAYWNGWWKQVKVKVAQLCPTLWPSGLYSPWDSLGQNTGVGSLSLLQGIFPTQGLNPDLPHCRWILWYWSVIFISYDVLVWFCYQDNAEHIKWVAKCSLLFYILGEFVKILLKLFKCLVEFTGEAVCIWSFHCI